MHQKINRFFFLNNFQWPSVASGHECCHGCFVQTGCCHSPVITSHMRLSNIHLHFQFCRGFTVSVSTSFSLWNNLFIPPSLSHWPCCLPLSFHLHHSPPPCVSLSFLLWCLWQWFDIDLSSRVVDVLCTASAWSKKGNHRVLNWLTRETVMWELQQTC